jgi:hypothetical protein
MAALSNADRSEMLAEFMSELSGTREPVAVTKTELRAAADAIDDWVEANKAAFNTAIPQPARAALTAAQKSRLLMFVVRQRFIKGA